MNPSVIIEHKVTFSETDMAGVAHFSNYFKWMEQAEHALFEKLNLPPLESFPSSLAGWPKIGVSCQYESPLYFQDKIQIKLNIEEIKTHSIRYNCEFLKVEQNCKHPVARGIMTAVFANISNHNRLIKAIPIDKTRLTQLKHTSNKRPTNPAIEY